MVNYNNNYQNLKEEAKRRYWERLQSQNSENKDNGNVETIEEKCLRFEGYLRDIRLFLYEHQNCVGSTCCSFLREKFGFLLTDREL